MNKKVIIIICVVLAGLMGLVVMIVVTLGVLWSMSGSHGPDEVQPASAANADASRIRSELHEYVPVIPPATAPASQPATVAQNPDEKLVSFGEFAFVVPQGWTAVTPDRKNTKAMLLFGSNYWMTSKAIIKVDVGTPVDHDISSVAARFARELRGSVDTDPVDLDGEKAVSVTSKSVTHAEPRNVVALIRHDKLILLMGSALEDVDLSAALSQIQQSWQWTPASTTEPAETK